MALKIRKICMETYSEKGISKIIPDLYSVISQWKRSVHLNTYDELLNSGASLISKLKNCKNITAFIITIIIIIIIITNIIIIIIIVIILNVIYY